MSLNNVIKIRSGKHLKTIIEEKYRTSEFHEIDNLNTKTLTEAVDSYEKTFVAVRDSLKNNEQYRCNDEDDRLAIAQAITDSLRKNLLIRKEA